MRTIEWSELTARLSAARDLRHLLREDMDRKLDTDKLGFATAAAQFFRAIEEDERCVNPNALEARKARAVSHESIESKGPDEDRFAEEICSDKSHRARLLQSNTREKE
ncbi:hypothetical protein [Erythrobacter longus]|uniref:hypothetical protein n=1 Tax=Erythrobacter longus TaxID=1044 RepID=UPI00126802A9|nr:hypothetical protein [Erythrobacter longus]